MIAAKSLCRTEQIAIYDDSICLKKAFENRLEFCLHLVSHARSIIFNFLYIIRIISLRAQLVEKFHFDDLLYLLFGLEIGIQALCLHAGHFFSVFQEAPYSLGASAIGYEL